VWPANDPGRVSRRESSQPMIDTMNRVARHATAPRPPRHGPAAEHSPVHVNHPTRAQHASRQHAYRSRAGLGGSGVTNDPVLGAPIDT
jgi:hypothetical protein